MYYYNPRSILCYYFLKSNICFWIGFLKSEIKNLIRIPLSSDHNITLILDYIINTMLYY